MLGAGGITGGAWLAGTLSEIAASSGWEPGTADLVVGTSAGAVFAALIASKIPARSLRPPDDPRAEHWPLRDLTLLESYAGGDALPSAAPRSLSLLLAAVTSGSSWTRGSRLLNALAPRGTAPTEAIRRTVGMRVPQGWVQHPACWIVATSRSTGRRVVFGRERRADLASAVAASCAIPGIFGPVVISGREYVDGGVASPTNADLAAFARLDVVICLNPLGRRPLGSSFHPAAPFEALVRESACRQVDKELANLEKIGIEVLRFEPGRHELAVMGLDPMDPTYHLEISSRAADHARLRVRELALSDRLRRQAA
ncbi:MAG: patatin-like phospholipase family protein [Candidatus Dormibacteraeota bacterium]|nr:patatin-like phospholipase family protein [Candidatus Dormibacteraeota bacterium]